MYMCLCLSWSLSIGLNSGFPLRQLANDKLLFPALFLLPHLSLNLTKKLCAFSLQFRVYALQRNPMDTHPYWKNFPLLNIYRGRKHLFSQVRGTTDKSQLKFPNGWAAACWMPTYDDFRIIDPTLTYFPALSFVLCSASIVGGIQV